MFLTSVAYASAEHGASAPLFYIGPLEVTSEITTMWGVMIFITVVCILGTRNMKRIPSCLSISDNCNVLLYLYRLDLHCGREGIEQCLHGFYRRHGREHFLPSNQ